MDGLKAAVVIFTVLLSLGTLGLAKVQNIIEKPVRSATQAKNRMALPKHYCNRDCSFTHGICLICEYEWTITWYKTMSSECGNCPQNPSDCLNPGCIPGDGYSPEGRPVIAVTSTIRDFFGEIIGYSYPMSPGPPIEVCEGDLISVKLYNDLLQGEGATIHWHGIHQKNTPYMDGVPMVTQCPIPWQNSFEYRFRSEEVGTHMWHGHMSTHRADGFYGALIIRQRGEVDPSSFEYDEDRSEHVLVSSDFTKEVMLVKMNWHVFNDGGEAPESIIINGKGVFDESASHTTPRYEVTVDPNRRYRFRIIQAGFLSCPYMVSVQGHQFKLIASEGNPTTYKQPGSGWIDNWRIASGETIDIVVHTNAAPGVYRIRFQGEQACEEAGTYGDVIMRYSNAPIGAVPVPYTSPVVPRTELMPWFNYNANGHYAAHDSILTAQQCTKFFFSLDYDPGTVGPQHKYVPHWHGVKQIYPNHPPVSQYADFVQYDAGKICNPTADSFPQELGCSPNLADRTPDNLCECLPVVIIDKNDCVEMFFVDQGVLEDFDHPIHMHGYAFRLIGRGQFANPVSLQDIKDMDAAGQIPRNLDNPVIKNTVQVPKRGYALVRFRASNEGIWLMHCHLQLHADLGMATVMLVGDYSKKKPPKDFPTCGNWDTSKDPSYMYYLLQRRRK